jgi:hypothetical protein
VFRVDCRADTQMQTLTTTISRTSECRCACKEPWSEHYVTKNVRTFVSDEALKGAGVLDVCIHGFLIVHSYLNADRIHTVP